MSKRLQVLLEESEFAEIRRLAKRRNLTVAEWVREALRSARRTRPTKDAARKLAAVREAAKLDYPTSDIHTMSRRDRARLRRGRFAMIFIDSNVPMYLVGGDHPHKVDTRRLLQRMIADGERLVTDVEVFQEILHRFVALGRRDCDPVDVRRPAGDGIASARLKETDRISATSTELKRLGVQVEEHEDRHGPSIRVKRSNLQTFKRTMITAWR